MRAVMSVLRAAANNKQKSPELGEDLLMLRSIRWAGGGGGGRAPGWGQLHPGPQSGAACCISQPRAALAVWRLLTCRPSSLARPYLQRR
jgi:hypothetical protein